MHLRIMEVILILIFIPTLASAGGGEMFSRHTIDQGEWGNLIHQFNSSDQAVAATSDGSFKLVHDFGNEALQSSPGIKIRYMAFIKGECLSAKLNGNDLTEQCKDLKVTHTLYQTGRAGFLFLGIASFSGNEDTESHKEKYTLTVNSVLTGSDSKEMTRVKGAGTCSIDGNLMTVATITCNVKTEKEDDYHIVFASKERPKVVFERGFEPPDLQTNIIYAIDEFDQVYRDSGIKGVQKYVEDCYPAAVQTKRLPAVSKCMAIDYAGYFVNILAVKSGRYSAHPFFAEAAVDKRANEQVGILRSRGGSENTAETDKKTDQYIGILKQLTVKTFGEFLKNRTKNTK